MILGQVGLAGNRLPARVRMINRQDLRPFLAEVDVGSNQFLGIGVIIRVSLRVSLRNG